MAAAGSRREFKLDAVVTPGGMEEPDWGEGLQLIMDAKPPPPPRLPPLPLARSRGLGRGAGRGRGRLSPPSQPSGASDLGWLKVLRVRPLAGPGS